MRYIDEYRRKDLVKILLKEIHRISRKPVAFMEVCGGHTMAIQKFGIPDLLPHTITLKSGPGCPVCVSARGFIDTAISLSQNPEVIITTYGDLIRVPGSKSNLDKAKAAGSQVKIVYSVLEAIQLAIHHPQKKIIFLGIGFETTAPATAAAIVQAANLKLKNFYLLSAHKVMPPAMTALMDESVAITGFLCPGHVSTITGTSMYQPLVDNYGTPCVVAGFEPVDILQSILMLVQQVESNQPKIEIQYTRAVKPEGNEKARNMLQEVFDLQPDWWRGLGVIDKSGLKLNDKYKYFAAEEHFEVTIEPSNDPSNCICGEVLKGVRKPHQCQLFDKGCHPGNPVGACMVSHEGACNAYFRYNR